MAIITFHYSYKSYTKEYLKKIEISNLDFNLAEAGWLWELYGVLAHQSQTVGKNYHFPTAKRGLELLKDDSDAQSLMNKSSRSATSKEIEALFYLLEEKLADSRFKKFERMRISTTFRHLILNNLHEINFENLSSPKQIRFRTKLTVLPTGRVLISDLISQDSQNNRPPLGAIPFDNSAELKDLSSKTLEKDLLKIRSCAVAELEHFKTTRNYLLQLSARKKRKQDVRFLRSLLQENLISNVRGKKRIKLLQLTKEDPEGFLGLYVWLTGKEKLAFLGANPIYWGARDFVTDIQKSLGGPIIKNKHFIQLPYRACTLEIFCAILVIMTYTGWNIDSVLNMTLSSIDDSDESAIIIQGFKGKVDEESPPFVIEKNMSELLYAIRLVKWNHANLINLGYLKKQEQRLWFGWTLAAEQNPHQMMGHAAKLAEFCNRNSLPRFSYDQLRTQVLAATYARSGSHDLTRHLAGHKSLYTLAKYLDQLMTARANSSINLEFSRRLEREVYFDMASCDLHSQFQLGQEAVPIGDGTTCLNPTAPPHQSYIDGELCDGLNCHTGSGCPNRKIIIDMQRMHEVIRKRIYFRNNWERLVTENPQAFEKFIFPNFIFIERLCSFIQSSPYSEVFEEQLNKIGENYEA